MEVRRYLCSALMFLTAAFGSSIPVVAQDTAAPDLMSFAGGVLPLSVTASNEGMKPKLEAMISAIDGNPVGFIVTKKPGAALDAVEMTYALPALTRFERGVDFRKRPGRG